MLRCDFPACPVDAPSVGELAGHLISDHDVNGSDAMARARKLAGKVAPAPAPPAPTAEPQIDRTVLHEAVLPLSSPPTEASMPKSITCKKCGKPGHNARTCGKAEAEPPKREKRSGGGQDQGPRRREAAHRHAGVHGR